MAAGMTAQERRGAPRVHERIAFAIGQDGKEIRSETKNISTAGAYCLTDQFIAPMTKLQLRLELPHSPKPVKIECEGVVVRAEPVVQSAQQGQFHIAVYFSEMSERDRAHIARFVQARLASHPSSH
jgi:c-di-GMP-binding flagellar brake protein YcgR